MSIEVFLAFGQPLHYNWIQLDGVMRTSPFNLRQQAYDRIRDLLRSGEMPPGARVSSLELSRRLGISRTPVREALSRLCADGVVREVPGFGVCVHQPDETELRELYGMREVLETYAAREAAIHINEDELTRLHELLLQWRGLARHLKETGETFLDRKLGDRWIKIDERFHDIVLVAARNKLLYKTVSDMRLTAQTLEAKQQSPGSTIALGAAAKTYRDHTRLWKALNRHDSAAADYWMREQLRMGRDRHLAEMRRQEVADAL
jgi:DNA-binding GntR family transcriptional regulator